MRKRWIRVERWACPDDHAALEASLRPKQKNVCGGGVFGLEGLGGAPAWSTGDASPLSYRQRV